MMPERYKGVCWVGSIELSQKTTLDLPFHSYVCSPKINTDSRTREIEIDRNVGLGDVCVLLVRREQDGKVETFLGVE